MYVHPVPLVSVSIRTPVPRVLALEFTTAVCFILHIPRFHSDHYSLRLPCRLCLASLALTLPLTFSDRYVLF